MKQKDEQLYYGNDYHIKISTTKETKENQSKSNSTMKFLAILKEKTH